MFNMKPSPWTLSLIGLVLLGSAMAGRSSTTPGQSSGRPPAPEVTPPRVDGEAETSVLHELGLDVLVSQGWSVESFVATLPDPIDSHVVYKFDRYVDAIQRAAEETGYVLDCFSFPWSSADEQGEGTTGPERSFHITPGALVFRDASNQALLLVHLVGETPTGGIHREALIEALKRTSMFSKGESVRILGPSFSGSITSLWSAIEQWREDQAFHVDVVSGAATAVNLKATAPPSEVNFRATVPHDKVTYKATLDYIIDELKIPEKQIAVLSEANTSYGRGVVGKDWSEVLHLPYPLQISDLRSARSKGTPTAPDSTGAAPLPLGDYGYPVDVPRLFSSLETYTVEATIAKILKTINREKYRYVGLLGTNIKDRLFLAREIRKHCPNVTLFTFGADLLYLNPGENNYLRGMLVASPYPLFGLNQTWTSPGRGPHGRVIPRKRLQFSDSNAQGVYNAMLALLGHQPLLEYGPPHFVPDPRPCHKRPPLWVSVVGIDNLWPVVALPLEHPDNYMLATSEFDHFSEEHPERKQSNYLFFLSLFVLTISLAYLIIGVTAGSFDQSKTSRYRWLLWSLVREPLQLRS